MNGFVYLIINLCNLKDFATNIVILILEISRHMPIYVNVKLSNNRIFD